MKVIVVNENEGKPEKELETNNNNISINKRNDVELTILDDENRQSGGEEVKNEKEGEEQTEEEEKKEGVKESEKKDQAKKPGATETEASQAMDENDVITIARTSRRICGSAASSSDSETADDAPLLPDEGGASSSSSSSQAVRIDIPGGDKPTSPHDRFPKRPWKTFFAFITLTFAATLNTIVLSYVHEKYPKTPPLPDIVFDNLPYYKEGLAICETLMIISFVCVLVLIVFHRHRWIVARRLFTIGAVLYLLRSVTLIVTQVPVADPNWHCAPRLGENATAWRIVWRGIKMMAGVGLNVNGDNTLCGDYIYSGHTIVLVVSALFMSEYSPRRWWFLHIGWWILAVVGVVFLVISHGHYTIDVILSYFICTRVFWIYHTMAAHPTLRSSIHNHHRKEFWFATFRWLESDIQRPIPRRFDCPFPLNHVYNAIAQQRNRRNNRME